MNKIPKKNQLWQPSRGAKFCVLANIKVGNVPGASPSRALRSPGACRAIRWSSSCRTSRGTSCTRGYRGRGLAGGWGRASPRRSSAWESKVVFCHRSRPNAKWSYLMVFCWKRWSVISVVKKLSHVCGSCVIRPSNMFSSGILAPRTLCFTKFSMFFEQLYSGKYYQTTII